MTQQDVKMEYRFLGRTGIKVSNICLGTMTFGSGVPLEHGCSEELSHEIINRYVELGGNFIDTADVYSIGASETIVGHWIEKNERDNIVLATKARFDMRDPTTVNKVGLSRRHLTASIDNSLSRLHTDYVDLYQTHLWDEATNIEETLRTLDDLIRCGKIRYAGVSNVTGWQLQKIVDTCKSLGLNPIASLQQQYSLMSRFSEIDAFQVCKLEGIAVLPWSPLKGGMLTGKFKRNQSPSEGRVAWVAGDEKTRTSEVGPAWSKIDDKTFDIVETAEKIAQERGKSTAQVALRWALQKDVVSSIIIGATKTSQLEDNMAAASGWTLSAEEMQQLDDVSAFDIPYPFSMIFNSNKDRKNPTNGNQHISSV